jgi:hypothetical protein
VQYTCTISGAAFHSYDFGHGDINP